MSKGAKTGGREAGTPNKVTATQRAWLSAFLDEKREEFQEDWKALDPKDRVYMYEKFMQYVCPRLQTTTLSNIDGTPLIPRDNTLKLVFEDMTDPNRVKFSDTGRPIPSAE